jgi:L-asparaginase II
LAVVRDAMLAHPELVAGTRERLDTSLMKAAPGRLVSKGGMEGLRGVGILRGVRGNGVVVPASGMALKIEDGAGFDRGSWAASVDALRQAGVLEGQALRVLSRYHRPIELDPHGRIGAEAIADFDLAPVGELIG